MGARKRAFSEHALCGNTGWVLGKRYGSRLSIRADGLLVYGLANLNKMCEQKIQAFTFFSDFYIKEFFHEKMRI